jgi:ABC-type multidrug transport system ATPase subunit
MLKVELSGITRSYGRSKVCHNVNLILTPGSATALIGPNGSGKSTLLKIIAGYTTPQQGTIRWSLAGHNLPISSISHHLSFCSPAVQLPVSLTVEETIRLHFILRKAAIPEAEVVKFLQLPAKKLLSALSSGMMQRLKLGLALFTQSDLLLLDEPTMNLDSSWKKEYLHWITPYLGKRTIVIASNDESEYAFCSQIFPLSDG